jgi:hypothetical protein
VAKMAIIATRPMPNRPRATLSRIGMGVSEADLGTWQR